MPVVSSVERRQALVESVRSSLLVPLMHADRVVGIVSLGSFAGESTDQIRQTFVRAIADFLAAALDRPAEVTTPADIRMALDLERGVPTPGRRSLVGILDSARRTDEFVESR